MSTETTNTDIRPFSVAVPQADLDDLVDRLRRTRWPDQPGQPDHPVDPGVASWNRGVPLGYLRGLAIAWAEDFDWRAQEARLNEHPQFVTTIDGQDLHFEHVRSPEPDALPLLLLHGWPSSPFEFHEIVGPLTDPMAHGGSPAPAFHVVAPSLPGYGFSTPAAPGWGNLFRVAQACAELMDRLGYQRYAVHGTDAGAGVAGLLGMVAGERVVGVHLTGTAAAMPFGPALDTSGLDERDRARAERFHAFQRDGLGYLMLQSTRPQTLAYALTDSPVAQLAWIAEKFHEWTDPAHELPDEAVGREALLTVVSIAWFTRSGGSSAHATYEGMQVWRQMEEQGGFDRGQAPTGPPTGVAVFAADSTIRSVMDPQGRITHWSEYDRGGHFPAMETPDLLVPDLVRFFGPLR